MWELEPTDDELGSSQLVKGLDDYAHVSDGMLHLKPAYFTYLSCSDPSAVVPESEIETEDEQAGKDEKDSRTHNPPAVGGKVKFSDGEEEEDAYQKFKNRKAVKRKRDAVSTRKAKAEAKKSRTTRDPTRESPTDEKPAKKVKRYGDTSDDDLMESTLPDYLQQRRKMFEVDRERLKEAGLNLPPDYGDIDFSDDERLEHLQERPQFPLWKPSTPYKDIKLPYSLGVIPAPVAQWLRDYQVEGVAFLHELFVYQRGGILGDDMGLGGSSLFLSFSVSFSLSPSLPTSGFSATLLMLILGKTIQGAFPFSLLSSPVLPKAAVKNAMTWAGLLAEKGCSERGCSVGGKEKIKGGKWRRWSREKGKAP